MSEIRSAYRVVKKEELRPIGHGASRYIFFLEEEVVRTPRCGTRKEEPRAQPGDGFLKLELNVDRFPVGALVDLTLAWKPDLQP